MILFFKKRDNKNIIKLCCPKCNKIADIDSDQFNGKISIECNCGFHETINFVNWIN